MNDFIALQKALDDIAFKLGGVERETILEARSRLFQLNSAVNNIRLALDKWA